MDHYGFGASARPPSRDFGYRPSDHTSVLTAFVDALDLHDATLLVQDWGGPIGLGMAVQRPDRIQGILVMNTWAWQVTDADASGPYGALTRWSQLNHDIGPDLVSSGLIVTGAAQGLAAPYPQPQGAQILDAFLGPFFDPTTGALRTPTIAEPTGVFALSIIDDQAMFGMLGSLAPLTDKPLYLYFGGKDPLFGALTPNPDGTCALGAASTRDGTTVCAGSDGARIYPFIDRFRSLWNAEAVRGVEVNDEANHFVQDQAPERVAAIVEELAGGG